MPRTFLTGATGFVGANVARHLLAQGHEVVCAVRKPNRCTEGLPVELVSPSLTDEDALAEAMRGCDGVLHVAGIFDPGPGGDRAMWSLHVDATRALLAARARLGISRFVTCSSSVTVGFGALSALGDESSPIDPERVYGRSGGLRSYYESKLESERLSVEAGAVVVNPDYVLGAWDIKPTSGQLLLAVARGWVPVYPTGGKCFIDADDCAIGHIRALEVGRPGRRYLLGNWNLSYREFMATCAEAAGTRSPALPVPRVALRAAAAVGSVLQRVDAHRFAGLDRHVLGSMMQERYRSGQRSWDELGVPRTPIASTVDKSLRWFRDHGYL
ncbi:MAG: NAD-dependent epimerase/dehydratase family protein [Myxococcales bacterium]|nr:NAD-dependent epimerase/dehydratase family protein [Myxococcales bacterium]